MRRWLLVALGAAALVGLFLLLRPDADPAPTSSATPTPEITATATSEPTPNGETPGATSTPTPDAVEIEVKEGRVQGPDQITVALGERVAMEIESDVADHVHVHTYEILRDIAADGKVTIAFRATIPGVFEIELEDAGVLLTRLTVTA